MVRGLATFVGDDRDLLARGLIQSPGNVMIQTGIAAVDLRAGRIAEGRARLERLCVQHPTAMSAGMVYARRLLEIETFQSEIERINTLSAEKRFDDVIAIADHALTRDLDPTARGFMENVRHRMGGYKRVCAAVEFANRGEIAAAKQSLDAVLAADPDAVVMKEAQRVLQEISGELNRNRVVP